LFVAPHELVNVNREEGAGCLCGLDEFGAQGLDRGVVGVRHLACKSRSNNPSLKRPICSVAPE